MKCIYVSREKNKLRAITAMLNLQEKADMLDQQRKEHLIIIV